jgi:hypothetical protein
MFVLRLLVLLMGVIGGIQLASVIRVLWLTLVRIFVTHVIGMSFKLFQGSVCFLIHIISDKIATFVDYVCVYTYQLHVVIYIILSCATIRGLL